MKTIELIVPCYNEEKCVALFYNRIKEVFAQIPDARFVITYVDDGSRDRTMEEIKKVLAAAEQGTVQYISLSRNFGKESAIYAGLSRSTGDYVAVLDADLQHPPELLIEMLDALEKEGYDCASARRVSRKGEPVFRSLLSKTFYHVINHITVIDLVPGSTDYRLMKRSVVDAIVSMSEKERFTKGIYAWVGFKNKWIEYENVERVLRENKMEYIRSLQICSQRIFCVCDDAASRGCLSGDGYCSAGVSICNLCFYRCVEDILCQNRLCVDYDTNAVFRWCYYNYIGYDW